MTAHGYVKGAQDQTSVDFAFFVNGEAAITGSGAVGRWGAHRVWAGFYPDNQIPVVFKHMRIVQKGIHNVTLMYSREAGSFTAHDLTAQVCMCVLCDTVQSLCNDHE